MIAPLDDLPDWTFEIDEASMGVYEIRGKHTLGWTIEITGTSERDLIFKARKAAQEAGASAEAAFARFAGRRSALALCFIDELRDRSP